MPQAFNVQRPPWRGLALLVAVVAFATVAQSSRLAAQPAPDQLTTFGSTEFIPFCGIDNFAWTVGNALARSAQPPDQAWLCLRDRGFTTIIVQNLDSAPAFESAAVAWS